MTNALRAILSGTVLGFLGLGCSAGADDKPASTGSEIEQALRLATQNPSAFSFFTQPDPTTDLTIARDFNPDPRIVEVVLVATETDVELIPGVKTHMLTYDGVFPGPQIIGNVGDTVIAHVINGLSIDTTIHWHGVELPAVMDGSFISQEAIPPGGYFRYQFRMLNPALYWYHPHIRTDKTIESGLQATLLMRDRNERQTLGIGAGHERTFQLDDILLVDDPASPDFGQLYPFALDNDFLDDPVHTAAERAELIFNGRDDDRGMLLVNGRGTPDPEAHPEDLPTVYVEKGVPERWRLVNTANGRFMRVSIPGKVLYEVGSDGGLLEHPVARQPIDMIADPDDPSRVISNPDPDLGVLLSVAERSEVVYIPDGDPGDVSYLEWHDYPRGRHKVVSPGELLENGMECPGPAPCFEDHPEDGKRAPRKILRIVVRKSFFPPRQSYELPSDLRDLTDIRGNVDLSNLDQALPITFGHAPPTTEGLVTFFAAVHQPTALLTAARAATGPVPPPAFGPAPLPAVLADPALAVWSEVGATRYWEAVNFTGNDHPLHTHGFFFQPIETRFVDLDVPENNRTEPYPYLALKDTIRLPKRTGALGRTWTITRMAVKFSDEDRPAALQRNPADLIAFGGEPSEMMSGGWLDHCHIDEHAASGMMTFLNIVPPGYPIPTP